MKGEWSCYRNRQFKDVMEVANLKEREWSCYRGGQFKGGRMVVMLQVEGEWSCYRGGHFNRGRMVMLQR